MEAFEGKLPVPATGAEPGRAGVLVVDDEPAIRRFVARVLDEEGYEVTEAGDGTEALDMIRAGAANPEIVITDIVMPKMNGVELLQSLSLLRPALPVILMSGYGAAQLAVRGIATPCGVLSKPFSGEVLVAEVRRCVRSVLP